jgi:DUF971 family protein
LEERVAGEDHWPQAIQLADQGKTLKVTFESGEIFALPAEFLRVSSPSAEVQGHDPSQKVTVPGKKNVAIARVEPVGNYAVRLVFDDGHDSGFYTWVYLFELGARQAELWQAYLDELAAKKLQR